MRAAVLAACAVLALAQPLTETATGADGQPATYPVTSDAYLHPASDDGIETAYTLSTGVSNTTFFFLVSAAAFNCFSSHEELYFAQGDSNQVHTTLTCL